MIQTLSDLSATEIRRNLIAEDDNVTIGRIGFHMSQEEQLWLLEVIATEQERLSPDRYEGVFVPTVDARKFIDKFNARKALADQKEAEAAERAAKIANGEEVEDEPIELFD